MSVKLEKKDRGKTEARDIDETVVKRFSKGVSEIQHPC